MANISKKCVEEIDKRGLKRKYVASRLGMTEARFSDLVNGRRQIRVEEALILADMFDLEVEEVIQAERVSA